MFQHFLVDTNIVSTLTYYKLGLIIDPENEKIAQWYDLQVKDATTVLNFAIVAELKRWVQSRKDKGFAKSLNRELTNLLDTAYIIHSNEKTMTSWARITHEAAMRGKFQIKNSASSQINDFWIAATAYAYNLTILTNDKGFGWMPELGIKILTCPD